MLYSKHALLVAYLVLIINIAFYHTKSNKWSQNTAFLAKIHIFLKHTYYTYLYVAKPFLLHLIKFEKEQQKKRERERWRN